ncbi:MAG: hypothetical protein ACOY93_03975 [Bacillota bacterium]
MLDIRVLALPAAVLLIGLLFALALRAAVSTRSGIIRWSSIGAATLLFSGGFFAALGSAGSLFGLQGWDDWNWDGPVFLVALALLWAYFGHRCAAGVGRLILFGGSLCAVAWAFLYTALLLTGGPDPR